MRRTALGFGLILSFSALLAAMVPGVQAGTSTAPEIASDPDNDVQILTTGQNDPTGMLAPSADLKQAWVADENATQFKLYVQGQGAIVAGLVAGQAGSYAYTFSFKLNGTTFTAGATLASGATTPVSTGKATAAALEGGVLVLTVKKSGLFSNITAGTPMSELFVSAQGLVSTTVAFSDRAPNGAAFGTNYEMTVSTPPRPVPTGFPNGAPGCTYKTGETNKTDNDADCLPDYWEKQYFTNTTAQNATKDPDADGISNYSEYIAGTDPTKKEAATTCTYKSGETNTTDTDTDCLPDYWEKQHFTNTTAQNATGDPDKDSCNNRCEYLRGSDPNKSDLTSNTNTGTNTGTNGPGACTFKAGETNKTDADGDCLPDYWEKDNFGNLGQAGSGDPDADGCTNRCEYMAGTDPNKADTDAQTAGDGPLEKLTANLDYIAESTAAALAVIGISIVALVRRWAL